MNCLNQATRSLISLLEKAVICQNGKILGCRLSMALMFQETTLKIRSTGHVQGMSILLERIPANWMQCLLLETLVETSKMEAHFQIRAS